MAHAIVGGCRVHTERVRNGDVGEHGSTSTTGAGSSGSRRHNNHGDNREPVHRRHSGTMQDVVQGLRRTNTSPNNIHRHVRDELSGGSRPVVRLQLHRSAGLDREEDPEGVGVSQEWIL